MKRLYRSLKEINIDFKINKNELINKLDELLERNNMQSDGQVYLQITRGSATRTHTFPVETPPKYVRSEEHTSELQSRGHLVCRLLLEKKKKKQKINTTM